MQLIETYENTSYMSKMNKMILIQIYILKLHIKYECIRFAHCFKVI